MVQFWSPPHKIAFPQMGWSLLAALAFGLAYGQYPLYYSNQNVYFLHGLANAGRGFLAQDWLTQTPDVYPVFSIQVELTARFLPEPVFYLYYLVILGIYVLSVLGIAAVVYSIDRSRTLCVAYLALVTALHSALLGSALSGLAGINLGAYLLPGLAQQYILGPALQPSTFNVFLLLSIYAALRGRPFWAVLFSSVAVIVHSVYVSAAALTLAYVLSAWREERNMRKALALAAFATALSLPILGYVYLTFQPTSPAIWSQAQHIMADYRQPHHAQPGRWLDGIAVLQIMVIVLALFLVRRKGRIFTIMLISFVVATALTVAQVITGSVELALLFPWRISVFLFPLSVCLLVAGGLSAGYRLLESRLAARERAVQRLFMVVILVLVLAGLLIVGQRFIEAHQSVSAPLLDFVTTTRQPGDLYLVPPRELENFRLSTGVPILVDWKTIPYRDADVLEWYNRLRLADGFYAARGAAACAALQDIVSQYGVTHVVVASNRANLSCAMLGEVYRDGYFTVYKIIPQ